MSTTAGAIKTLFNTYIGDSTNDRLSDAEKYNYITEATAWLLEELGNEHMMAKYDLDYLDTVYKYKITTDVADLLVGADLRRDEDLHFESFTRKSPREIYEDIAQKSPESSWAVDRYGDDAYLVINHVSEYIATEVIRAGETSENGGTWTVDADATNLTEDTNEFKKGSSALNFDLDVSADAANTATLYIADIDSENFSTVEDLGTFVLWVFIPDVTETSSVTLVWSSDASGTPSTISNYWTSTQTTDADGNSFSNGWNRVKFDWDTSTVVGSPDSSAIVYFHFDVDYTASQGDDTDYRINNLVMVRPEPLSFHYISYNVGENSGGTALFSFTADTDVPFFSGKYDQYKHVVAHKAASLAFYSALRLRQEGAQEEAEAIRALDRYRKNFESSKVRESKNFKVKGINFRQRYRGRPRFTVSGSY